MVSLLISPEIRHMNFNERIKKQQKIRDNLQERVKVPTGSKVCEPLKSGLCGEIPQPTVKSGWEKIAEKQSCGVYLWGCFL